MAARRLLRLAPVLMWLLMPGILRAEIRFDVFIGFDGTIPRLGWFPVVCEVLNEGPAFDGVFELQAGNFGQGDSRQMRLELPTGTLKRFVIPVHAPTLYTTSYDARLRDARGRIRAETLDIRVRQQDSTALPLVAAVARSLPVFPEMKDQRSTLRPRATRMQPQLFPDNPIALEGLDTLYLTTGRALELKPAQAEALRLWMYGGGHLILGVEQAAHIEGLDWLGSILPCRFDGSTLVGDHRGLHNWLVSDRTLAGLTVEPRLDWSSQNQSSFSNPYGSLAEDDRFESKDMQVALATSVKGRVIAGPTGQPLVISAERGLGRITVLTFNPDLEPFDSWALRPHFWAKICDLPPELLLDQRINVRTPYQNLDGVLAAMIETRQVRKLPVGWLLLLLVVYMLVIGPVDRYWLKKINRQMLTWLTFPAYVAFFSVLIYFIGYKLRAGETEWNEVHLVDVLKTDAGTAWHGRSYGIVYSPANARYGFASEEPFAAMRSEFSNSDPGRSTIQQVGNAFAADVSVSVWTSRLMVNNWWRPGDPAIAATLEGEGDQGQLTVRNDLGQPCSQVSLVHQHRIYHVGSLEPGESKRIAIVDLRSERLSSFVDEQTRGFHAALGARRNAFGSAGWSKIQDMTNATMAVSFIQEQSQSQFLTAPGFDLSSQSARGDSVLLAWTTDYAPSAPIHQFKPKRGRKDVLWRVLIPANPGAGL